MHKNYVLNSSCLIEFLKGLNWTMDENIVKFEFFNDDNVSEYIATIWMYHQVVFYDNENSINFSIKNYTETQSRKSFNINHINWITINNVRFDMKHNICSSKVFSINDNVKENHSKKVILSKVA